MTQAEKIAMVKVLVENDPTATDEVITVYMSLARNAILQRLWPLHPEKTTADIPERCDMIECELAARYFLRRGAQGEINHEETGVKRQWGSADDSDILQRLPPFVKAGV